MASSPEHSVSPPRTLRSGEDRCADLPSMHSGSYGKKPWSPAREGSGMAARRRPFFSKLQVRRQPLGTKPRSSAGGNVYLLAVRKSGLGMRRKRRKKKFSLAQFLSLSLSSMDLHSSTWGRRQEPQPHTCGNICRPYADMASRVSTSVVTLSLSENLVATSAT